MQTGRYATQTGCFRNGVPLREDAVTMAKCFAEGGYETGYIGKWHLGSEEPVPPSERGGYQRWLGANLLEFVSDAYDTVLFDGQGNRLRLPGYRVDALTDAAIRYVAEERNAPYFLFLSFLEPHHQNHVDGYPAPDGYREKYTGRWIPPDLAALGGTANSHLSGYYGMVKRLDEALGRLMDALKSLGQEDNTIVLFTSDHACHFKTRNGEYKRSCHESAIRVPTMITGPGFEGGGQRQELFSIVDVAPTLLDAAGLNVPGEMAGHSILPRLRGEGGWRDTVFVQVSETETGRAIRSRRWKYGVAAPANSESGAAKEYDEAYLYDLEHDPWEQENLAGMASHRDVAVQLGSHLLDWIARVEGLHPTITECPSRDGGQRRVKEADIDFGR